MEKDIRQAKQYSKLKIWAAIVQFVLTIAFLAIMIFSGASALLKDSVSGWTQSFYLQVGLYLAIFSGLFSLLFLLIERLLRCMKHIDILPCRLYIIHP